MEDKKTISVPNAVHSELRGLANFAGLSLSAYLAKLARRERSRTKMDPSAPRPQFPRRARPRPNDPPTPPHVTEG